MSRYKTLQVLQKKLQHSITTGLKHIPYHFHTLLTLVLFRSALSSPISSSRSNNVSRACVSSLVNVANSYLIKLLDWI